MKTRCSGLRRWLCAALALLLCLALLPAAVLAETKEDGGAVIRLTKYESTVTVKNGSGQKKSVFNNMQLYSGWTVETPAGYYAWLSIDANTDNAKVIGLGGSTKVELRKNGLKNDIYLLSGTLFAGSEKAMKDNETVTIHTGTAICGIRGSGVMADAEKGEMGILYGHGWMTVPGAEMMALTGGYGMCFNPDTGRMEAVQLTNEMMPGIVGEAAQDLRIRTLIDEEHSNLSGQGLADQADNTRAKETGDQNARAAKAAKALEQACVKLNGGAAEGGTAVLIEGAEGSNVINVWGDSSGSINAAGGVVPGSGEVSIVTYNLTLSLADSFAGSAAELSCDAEVKLLVNGAEKSLPCTGLQPNDNIQLTFSYPGGDVNFATKTISASNVSGLTGVRTTGNNTITDAFSFKMPSENVTVSAEVGAAYEAYCLNYGDANGTTTITGVGSLQVPAGSTGTFAVPGQTVAVTATPDEGYSTTALGMRLLSEQSYTPITGGSFVMPEGTVEVKAEYAVAHSLTVNLGSGGSLKINGADVQNGTVLTIVDGAAVTLAVTPEGDNRAAVPAYHPASGGAVAIIEVENNSFDMPSYDAVLEVKFQAPHTITPAAVLLSEAGTLSLKVNNEEVLVSGTATVYEGDTVAVSLTYPADQASKYRAAPYRGADALAAQGIALRNKGQSDMEYVCSFVMPGQDVTLEGEQLHAIMIDIDENTPYGEVLLSGSLAWQESADLKRYFAGEGDPIMVTASLDGDHPSYVGHVQVTAGNSEVPLENGGFTMPHNGVKVYAWFGEPNAHLISQDLTYPDGYNDWSLTILVNDVEGISAKEGDTVRLEYTAGFCDDWRCGVRAASIVGADGKPIPAPAVEGTSKFDEDGFYHVTYSFTMPAQEVTARATFAPMEEIANTTVGTGSLDIVTNGVRAQDFYSGEGVEKDFAPVGGQITVKVKTGTVQSLQILNAEGEDTGLTPSYDENQNCYTFTMPSEKITVSVVFA